MKKVLFFCICSFLSIQQLAQTFQKKQITNFNYDSRGASFPNYPFGLNYLSISTIFFEAHEGNASNIRMMNYNSSTDSFYNPISITMNNYKNINPIADAFYHWSASINKLNLIWQTNENGNWDIALKTRRDSIWGEKELIINSSTDETNPKYILRNYWSSQDTYEIEILYEKDNSIYLYQQKDSLINNEKVFSGNDSFLYSQPTGIRFSGQPNTPEGLYIAATCKPNDSTAFIVIRIKTNNNPIWSPIYILYDNGYCEHPKFCNPYFYYPFMSFERIKQGNKQICIIRELQNIGQVPDVVTLIDNENVNTSDFSFLIYGIVGKVSKTKQYDFHGPHSYKILSNDSVYIANPYPYWNEYGRFYSKISNTRIGLGNLGSDNWGAISYVIWEDSSDGHVNLFGFKRYDQLGDIDDYIIAENFTLFQNYPNPFNPKTVIQYSLLSREFVTLKVFDVLGNEVAALVKEEKDAGEYKLEFDGSNLASGIYVYRLSVGSNHVSKKMILLK